MPVDPVDIDALWETHQQFPQVEYTLIHAIMHAYEEAKTKNRCVHDVWKGDHCFDCAKVHMDRAHSMTPLPPLTKLPVTMSPMTMPDISANVNMRDTVTTPLWSRYIQMGFYGKTCDCTVEELYLAFHDRLRAEDIKNNGDIA